MIDAGVLPAGALSVVCGSSAGLMDALEPFDVVSFTGSAETAALIRSHPAVTQRSVRVNIEADSVNSALLLPGEAPGSEAFDLLVKEVAREMTHKVRPEMHRDPPRVRARGAVRRRRPKRSRRAWPRPPSATRATRACAWARWSAARNWPRCAKAWPT